MSRSLVIFKKEMLDTLRDKRTLMIMVVIPLVVVPALISLAAAVARRQQRRAEAATSKVAFVGRAFAPELYRRVQADSLFLVVNDVAPGDIEPLIQADSLDGALVVPSSFRKDVDNDWQASVEISFRSSNTLNVTQRRLHDVIEAYDSEIVASRIRRLDLDENLFDAIEVTEHDVATLQEVLGKTLGGFLPYIFIVFMFTGSMYPGIDLGAGEKERGTLETLLSSPASRTQIVLGKFAVIGLIGLASAMVSMVGLYLGVQSIGDIPQDAIDVVWQVLNVKVVAMIATLLIPLAAFFAAVILAASIHAKSFKEAQSSLTPLTFLLFVPVVIGLLPGVELSAATALVPILNVSLATKDVIAGTIVPLHIAVTYVSLFGLAALSLWCCVQWFNREATLFRT